MFTPARCDPCGKPDSIRYKIGDSRQFCLSGQYSESICGIWEEWKDTLSKSQHHQQNPAGCLQGLRTQSTIVHSFVSDSTLVIMSISLRVFIKTIETHTQNQVAKQNNWHRSPFWSRVYKHPVTHHIRTQMRWAGHVVCMEDNKILKQLFKDELQTGLQRLSKRQQWGTASNVKKAGRN